MSPALLRRAGTFGEWTALVTNDFFFDEQPAAPRSRAASWALQRRRIVRRLVAAARREAPERRPAAARHHPEHARRGDRVRLRPRARSDDAPDRRPAERARGHRRRSQHHAAGLLLGHDPAPRHAVLLRLPRRGPLAAVDAGARSRRHDGVAAAARPAARRGGVRARGAVVRRPARARAPAPSGSSAATHTLGPYQLAIAAARRVCSARPASSPRRPAGDGPKRTHVSTTEVLDAQYRPALPVASRWASLAPVMLTDAGGAIATAVAEDVSAARPIPQEVSRHVAAGS